MYGDCGYAHIAAERYPIRATIDVYTPCQSTSSPIRRTALIP